MAENLNLFSGIIVLYLFLFTGVFDNPKFFFESFLAVLLLLSIIIELELFKLFKLFRLFKSGFIFNSLNLLVLSFFCKKLCFNNSLALNLFF